MREVALLAYFGVFASLFVAAVVIAKGFLRAHITTVEYDNIKPSGISNAINIIVFGLGGHSVLPNIVNEMKRPKKVWPTETHKCD
jgi:amino acid permease